MSEEIWKAVLVRVVGGAVMGVVITLIEFMTRDQFIPFLFSHGLFTVSGILFRAWGAIAVYFGYLTSFLSYNPYIPLKTLLLLPIGPLFAALTPAWAFRHFKADPFLRTARDEKVFLVFGMIVNNFVRMIVEPLIWWFVFSYPWRMELIYGVSGFFVLGLMANMFITSPLLFAASWIVTKLKSTVKDGSFSHQEMGSTVHGV